ncbi:MAG: response regulator transcription factor [Syntrophomonadaceae bacterium]|nr:response regulator transcription factor [Syntrophomonadaceae bacterium]
MDLKVLIVDDEPANGLFLHTIIEQVAGVKVVAVCTSGREALDMVKIHHPQVVFLDVDMPEMNGLELACTLTERHPDIYIVFATAYPDYALQAFELYSFDYILKPFNEERIRKTLKKLQSSIEKQVSPANNKGMCIWVDKGRARVCLRPDDIVYLETCNHRTQIVALNDRYLTWYKIDKLSTALEPYGFHKCHRSYIVNRNQIKEIIKTGRTFQIKLFSGEAIPLSRKMERDFRNIILKCEIHDFA